MNQTNASQPVHGQPLSIALAAGEASGDLLAGLLLGGLNSQGIAHQSYGIGGAQMQAHGFEPWWSYHELAVRGYVEVLKHYRRIVGIRKQLAARLLADKPDMFIGVDAPDFNLDLELQLRQNGIKTVHFVSPSIWAWRASRLEKIKQACDHVLCIFPFETAIYDQAGVASTYVGHPLADIMPMVPDQVGARAALGLPQDKPVVALLPGSRQSEIAQLAPQFLQAARLMHQARSDLIFVLPVAPSLMAQVRSVVARAGLAGVDWLHLLDGQSHAALAACDVTLIASGTATLEAALSKRPMVIAYRMPQLSWQIMKRKRLQP
ncbi:MAG: lipid-A-disaccharide synthase, partial [Burkholderiaceae bacterium]|nr:lipid-A-disaccharide synthase [Burkholderiaceae bacterium]